MNARAIIRQMISERYRQSFCVPNYTPDKWWECDVFELTKADYMREYEVKISRADFFADSSKEKEVYPRGYGEPVVTENKHALLAVGDPRGPSAFFWVTPAGLLKPHEIQDWAGLIEIITDERYPKRLFERVVIEAPRLHKQKCDDAIRRHALGICYYRMHDLLGRNAA